MNVSTQILTPRREEQFQNKMLCTPAGDDAQLYKYYCPLCMSFFQNILKTQCCGNYTCVECTVSFINKHGYKVLLSYNVMIYFYLVHVHRCFQ